MSKVIVDPSEVTTFGSQIAKKLGELRELYKEHATTSSDIEALLADCERRACVLDALESQSRLISDLLPPNPLYDECRACCKVALNKLDLVARYLGCSRTGSKLTKSVKSLFRQQELSKQKDELKSVKDDIVLASQALDRLVYTWS